MRLTPPKQIVWWISVILVAVAVLGQFVTIPVIDGYLFWVATASSVLLILATALKGL